MPRVVKAPAFFGQRSLLDLRSSTGDRGWQWPYSIWCVTYCELFFLAKGHVRAILEQYPFLQESYDQFQSEEEAEDTSGEFWFKEDQKVMMSTEELKLRAKASEIMGTWEYMCGQWEYTITQDKHGQLWYEQQDTAHDRSVQGALFKLPAEESKWQASLSNRGKIRISHHVEQRRDGQVQRAVISEYQAPGSSAWGKPVVARRVNREVRELRDIDRSNQIHAELRHLQVVMGKLLDRYSTLQKYQKAMKGPGAGQKGR